MMYPGKKLNFMGNEFGQGREWKVGWELDWGHLENDWHRGIHALSRALNHLYRQVSALHEQDFDPAGFQWVDCHDADQSVLSFLRWGRDGSFALVAFNFTPVPRYGYRIGVPTRGGYNEVFNSDSRYFGGGDLGNGAGLQSEDLPWMGFPHSLSLTLPPLAGVVLRLG